MVLVLLNFRYDHTLKYTPAAVRAVKKTYNISSIGKVSGIKLIATDIVAAAEGGITASDKPVRNWESCVLSIAK